MAINRQASHSEMRKGASLVGTGKYNWVTKSYENQDVTCFVSDLTGFTSTTRKYGITHMASIIIRMRQLCLPIFQAHGAAHIGTEADNFIVIFPNTVEAVLAALEMINVLTDYQQSLTQERDHFKVKLNGIGIHCGLGIVLDKEDNFHGDTYNVAYNIGEDLCEKGNLLVTEDVRARLQSDERFAGVKFNSLSAKDMEDVNTYTKAIYEIDQTTI
jgi:class 3 adenylate cyclase